MFLKVGRPLLEKALQGYNTTLLAYGQTGSGKTFTIQGGIDSSRGIIPRVFDQLFGLIERENQIVSFNLVKMSLKI